MVPLTLHRLLAQQVRDTLSLESEGGKIVVAKRCVLSLLLASMLVGCASPEQQTTESDISAINNIWKEYEASINAGNAVQWASLWTDDGIQMPQGTVPIRGRQSIEKAVADSLNRFSNEQDITILETEIGGDWAFSRGTWISTLTPKETGQSYLIDGKFMTIFRRQRNGDWKIYRDIFNSNTATFVTPIDLESEE